MRNSKRYRSQQECAHAWVHRLSDNGHSSNFFFEGSIIYSYGHHFPIARLHGRTVFFTENTYSSSTAHQKSIASSAASHLEFISVHHVPVEDIDPGRNRTFIKRNIDQWVSEIGSLIDLYNRNPRRKRLLREIDEIHQKLLRFIDVLNIRPTVSLKRLLENLSQDTLLNFIESEKRRVVRNRKRAQKVQIAKFNQSLQKWKKAQTSTLITANPLDNNLAYLRVDTSAKYIETTKGIRVPLAAAEALYCYIRSFLIDTMGNPSFRILDFDISAIDKNFLIVGCHKIPMSEVEGIAQQMGWKTD